MKDQYVDALEGVAKQARRFVRALLAWDASLPKGDAAEWDEKTEAEWVCLQIELRHLQRIRRSRNRKVSA